ncbi:helix-turn-helix domain-containing protein [Aquimarina longa]|uniref:helix-turn-helix domain-containing protein n=1 Tax=Aquimarina longa TaxID=1080221 RepID=UPI000785284A|nr:helix-turn-helix domain-containing protein [Aquimarina longa]
MIKKYLFLSYLLILLTFAKQLNGQTKKSKDIQDTSNFSVLRARIIKETKGALRIKIVKEALHKAKISFDTLGMADAYYFLSKLDSHNALHYIDSLITITKKKKYTRYPALGYSQKGNIYYEKGNYKEALEFYLKGSKSAKENKNEPLYLSIKFNIGLLKNTAGERKEAQAIFLEHLNFVDQNPKFKKLNDYGRVLFALTDSYVYDNQLELAKEYIDKGIQQALKTNDAAIYPHFVVYSGVYHYLSKNYKTAIDSLEKGRILIKQVDEVTTRTAICDYYIARSYQDLGDKEKGIHYFKKVDSVLKKTEDVIPEIIDTYTYLIEDSKIKKNVEKQIEYINTLLRLDSIRHSDQIYLTKNINERYDTIELISEKEDLIDQLKQDRFLKEETITILILFLIVLVTIAVFGFLKTYISRGRLLKLLEEHQNKVNNITDQTDQASVITKKEDLDIPKEVIEVVLEKLYQFENLAKFSKKHYTLNSLAKELNTNSAYLSKIINGYKNINFSTYMNNLRVEYAIEQLASNKSLRSYTIKAIAEEVGFKNAQSFSSAFHKKTGIYPSYFIKHIDTYTKKKEG